MRGDLRGLAFAVWVLLAPMVCAAGDFRTVDAALLRITIDTDWGTRTAPGYVPVRLDITNLGDARVIDVVGEGNRFSMMLRTSVRTSVLQTLRMARGDRVKITIPVPVFAESENFRFLIQEGGETVQAFNYTGLQSGTPALQASALIVADRASPLGLVSGALPRAAPTSRARFAASAGGTAPTLDVVLEPSRLPTNWLGYTSLRAVVIGPEEWAMLDEAQKGALLTWTACGGDLIVAAEDTAALAGGGHRAPEYAPGDGARAYFLGRIHRRPAQAILSAGLAAVLADAERAQDSDWALPANKNPSWKAFDRRGFRLSIPGVSGIPTRAYLAILIVFSLLIGPVNYVVLRRRRRLVLFVLTAPLISAIFIVLLAGYVIAGEGFHVSGRAATFTVLDQARRQAVTRAGVSLYAAGMTPGGGLRFPRDVAVYSLGSDGAGSRDNQVLNLTETQQFASGLIQARAPTNLEQIAFRPARERLTIERDSGGGVRVVNGLGATIRHLAVRMSGQTYALNAPIADGATAVLKAETVDPAAFVPHDLPMEGRFRYLFGAQPDRSYLAVLDTSPFWDPGVRGVVERGSFHLVLGWPDGQPGEQ